MRKRLGEILAAKGYLTIEQVKQALKIQRHSANGNKIGQILLEQGFITPAQLQEGLEAQN